ncbi:uncharacterized protein LOC136080209 [Hydra vulgaris]|uniref:Uncharacterized protein LOC136080209 n=1 Tax=Hydra vulgaris TaxID=6087 RepID=A0ABM4BUP6_HYDVU
MYLLNTFIVLISLHIIKKRETLTVLNKAYSFETKYGNDIRDDCTLYNVDNTAPTYDFPIFLKVVKGLNGINNTVSFQSPIYNTYFRHKSYKIYLEYESSELFKNDASFILQEHKFYEDFTVIQSYNYPTYFIFSCDHRLYIVNENNAEDYKNRFSFKISDNSTSSSFQSASITATIVNEQTLKPSTLKPSQSALTQTSTVPDQTVKVLNSYIDGDNSTSSSFQSASITATIVNEQTLKPSTLKPSQSVLTQTSTVPDQTVKVLNSYIDGDHLFIWNITLKQPGSSLSSLNVLYDEFEITFDIYFNITDGTGNILLLQQNELPEETYLSIDYFNDEIVITQLIDTSKTKLILNAWNSVNISQQYINNAYSNKITINGNNLFFIDKMKPKIYFSLTLFACASNCQLLEIKNIHISSRTKVFWSQWSEWSTCNELCVSTRTRNCSNNQWLNCTGNSSSLKSCDMLFCQVFWSQWSEWSTCNELCVSTRTRNCSNNQWLNCTGNSSSLKSCDMLFCQGVWMQWSNWSKCIQPCGTSMMNRSRVCNTKNNFYNCSGNSTEMSTCFSNKACVSFWAQWGKWSKCMPSCGKSVIIRERVCNGTNCAGNS